MALFHGNAIPSAAEDYLIAKSCRFNDDDSAYLSRTPGGNRQPKNLDDEFLGKKK